MNDTDLIPTFAPGDRVLVIPRPSEGYACPNCGVAWFDEEVATNGIITPFEGRISEKLSGEAIHAACGSSVPLTEGTYAIRHPQIVEAMYIAPWPWLTRLDAVQA